MKLIKTLIITTLITTAIGCSSSQIVDTKEFNLPEHRTGYIYLYSDKSCAWNTDTQNPTEGKCYVMSHTYLLVGEHGKIMEVAK